MEVSALSGIITANFLLKRQGEMAINTGGDNVFLLRENYVGNFAL
jgi:hypothetical protein